MDKTVDIEALINQINARLDELDEKFIKIKSLIIKESNNNRVEFRVNDDMETRYILILADGSIVVTENRVYKTIGNVLLDINKINYL